MILANGNFFYKKHAYTCTNFWFLKFLIGTTNLINLEFFHKVINRIIFYVHNWLIDSQTYWLSDWLTDWVYDWLIPDSLINWLTDLHTCWLSDWPTDEVNDWHTDLPINWQTYSQTYWQSKWLIHWLANLPISWLTERLT